MDEPDIEGRSAFIWAAGKGADNVIKVYLKHNVDIQQVDSHEGSGIVCKEKDALFDKVKSLVDQNCDTCSLIH